MFQNILLIYFILIIFMIWCTNSFLSFKKFFFFSEVIWIILFLFLLLLEIYCHTFSLLTNSFLILVFTAVEAVIFATIILLESNNYYWELLTPFYNTTETK